MAGQKISDTFWNPVEPLLEPFKRKKSGGSPPVDFRCILNGIFYLLKTGCQWGHLPPCSGSKSTVHEHVQRWVQARGVCRNFPLALPKNIQEFMGSNGQGSPWTGC